MKKIFTIMCIGLFLFPCLVQAGQPEPPAVECIEGTPPEPIAVDFGEHTSTCQVDNPTDIDQFQIPIGTEDFGELLRLNVTYLGGSNFYPRVEVWDSCGDPVANRYSRTFTEDFAIPECVGDFQIVVSDANTTYPGSFILQVERIVPVYAPKIAYDLPVVDSIDPVTDVDFLVFDGAASTTIRLNATYLGGSNFYPRVEVWDPSGGNMDNRVDRTYSYDFDLIETGEYLVAISCADRNYTGSYEVEVNCLSPGSCPPDPSAELEQACGDGIDNDNDGATDCDDPDCTGVLPYCPDVCNWPGTCATEAEASVYGSPEGKRSMVVNNLAFLLIPVGTVIFLRIMRRKR